MKIAICDDERKYVEETENNVKAILGEQNIDAEFDLYFSSSDIFDCGKFYDIAFLDIEMEPYSGIEVAEKLKQTNPYIMIFIITSYDSYLDDAMDLNVFRYIKKPIDARRLKSGIIKALESIDSNIITFFLKNGEASTNVLSDDIVYIETTGRATRVVTVNGEYISENKMDFWKEKLIASFFYKVHKSYIINMKHISDYKRDTVGLCGKYSVPIAYRKQAEFRSYFLSYFGGR
ncbi:MAG: response regulator transcription factor [Clostridia bacterium]|nr:response regulator transcription factor [Clostridia bacterium]